MAQDFGSYFDIGLLDGIPFIGSVVASLFDVSVNALKCFLSSKTNSCFARLVTTIVYGADSLVPLCGASN